MPIQTFELDGITIDYDARSVYSTWEHSMEWLFEEYGDDEEFDLEAVGGNREFSALWSNGVEAVRDLCALESEQLNSIDVGELTAETIEEIEEEAYDADAFSPHMILDVGVRSLVMAILEAGGYPFSSCNAGSLNDDRYHAEAYPLIALYAPPECLRKIEQAARKNGCGMHCTDAFPQLGALVIYTDDIRNFPAMALDLLELI